jgi:hypothetical protein
MHLGHHMSSEVIGVLRSFMAFASSFQRCVVQNMLVLMFDQHFKTCNSFGIMWALNWLCKLLQRLTMKFICQCNKFIIKS